LMKTYTTRLILASLKLGEYPLLRATITLGIIVGFLYSLHIAPLMNKYYFVEPLAKAQFTTFYDLRVETDIWRNKQAMQLLVDGLLACLGNRDFIVIAPSTVDGKKVFIASSPNSVPLAFPDISTEEAWRAVKEGFDGLLIYVPDVTGYKRLSMDFGQATELVINCCGANESLKLLTAGSRSAFARYFVALLIGTKYAKLLNTLGVSAVLVREDKPGSLTPCLEELNKKLLDMYPGRPFAVDVLSVTTKEEAYRIELQTFYSTSREMVFFSAMALIVSAIVAFREGLAYAEASSELIGVLRLFGAPRRLLVVLGISAASLIYIGTVAGILVTLYIYFEVLLGGALAPLGYLMGATWRFFIALFAAIAAALCLSNIVAASRRNLESYVSTR